MKKYIMFALAATALNATTPTETIASKFSGFYTGVQAGINTTQNTFQVTANKNRVKYGSQSWLGGLFAGYGVGVGKSVYIGGEVFRNLVDNKIFFADTPFCKVSLKNAGNIGAKLRFGYVVSPQTMVFLGLGLEYSEWVLKSDYKIPAGMTPGINEVTKTEKRSVVFSPSVGTDIYLNNHVFLRPEYSYVCKVKMRSDIAFNEQKTGATQHRFTMGLGYKI
jgi:opacity protein-like surface antigen